MNDRADEKKCKFFSFMAIKGLAFERCDRLRTSVELERERLSNECGEAVHPEGHVELQLLSKIDTKCHVRSEISKNASSLLHC